MEPTPVELANIAMYYECAPDAEDFNVFRKPVIQQFVLEKFEDLMRLYPDSQMYTRRERNAIKRENCESLIARILQYVCYLRLAC